MIQVDSGAPSSTDLNRAHVGQENTLRNWAWNALSTSKTATHRRTIAAPQRQEADIEKGYKGERRKTVTDLIKSNKEKDKGETSSPGDSSPDNSPLLPSASLSPRRHTEHAPSSLLTPRRGPMVDFAALPTMRGHIHKSDSRDGRDHVPKVVEESSKFFTSARRSSAKPTEETRSPEISNLVSNIPAQREPAVVYPGTANSSYSGSGRFSRRAKKAKTNEVHMAYSECSVRCRPSLVKNYFSAIFDSGSEGDFLKKMQVNVLEHISDHSSIVHFEHSATWPILSRDFVCLVTAKNILQDTSKGKVDVFIMSIASISREEVMSMGLEVKSKNCVRGVLQGTIMVREMSNKERTSKNPQTRRGGRKQSHKKKVRSEANS